MMMILVSSLAMAAGSFLFGNLPLVIQLSEVNLNYISTFGAGLLIGTSFIIVLPEGVETVFTARIGMDQAKATGKFSAIEGIEDSTINRDIGLCLMVGFAFMLLVDQFGDFIGGGNSHQPIPISVNDFRGGSSGRNSMAVKSNTPTLGFVIHAAADGIAMGAAFSEESSGMGWIVFLAILIHKAPSAFGLATFLLAKRHSRIQIMKQIGVFSISAPVGAVITFFLINLWEYSEPDLLKYRTGMILLFSAGTFIYVACVHILPEIYLKEVNGHDHLHHSRDKNLSYPQLLLLVIGFIFPLLISIEHHH